jgi:hypothetical protein
LDKCCIINLFVESIIFCLSIYYIFCSSIFHNNTHYKLASSCLIFSYILIVRLFIWNKLIILGYSDGQLSHRILLPIYSQFLHNSLLIYERTGWCEDYHRHSLSLWNIFSQCLLYWNTQSFWFYQLNGKFQLYLT